MSFSFPQTEEAKSFYPKERKLMYIRDIKDCESLNKLTKLNDYLDNLSEENISEIISYIRENFEMECSYFISCMFLHYSKIRSNKQLFVSLIEALTQWIGHPIEFETIAFSNMPLAHYLYLIGYFEKSQVQCASLFEESQLTQQDLLDVYPRDSLAFHIHNDDIEKVQELMRLPDFSIKQSIELPPCEYVTSVSVNLLQFAARYGALKVFKLLILNDLAPDESICPFAVAGGNMDIISILYGEKCKFEDCFRLAIYYHRNEVADWLLEHVQCQEIDLDDCIDWVNFKAFYFAVSNGANFKEPVVHAIGRSTPFHAAIKTNCFIVARFMISRGIDVNAPSLDGNAPLAVAAMTGQYKIAEFLLDNGALPNKQNQAGYSPLSFAVSTSLEMVKLFVENGGDLFQLQKHNETLLHCACKKGLVDVIEYLLDNKLDINAVTDNGSTPLHIAIKKKHAEAAKILVNRGADTTIQDKAGKTAFDYDKSPTISSGNSN